MGHDLGAPAALRWKGRAARRVDFTINAIVADARSVTAADQAEYVPGMRSPGGLHGGSLPPATR